MEVVEIFAAGVASSFFVTGGLGAAGDGEGIGDDVEIALGCCAGTFFKPWALLLARDFTASDIARLFVSGLTGVTGGGGGSVTSGAAASVLGADTGSGVGGVTAGGAGAGGGSSGGTVGRATGGGRLASSSRTGIQVSLPSSRAGSESDNNPSSRYCRTCFSE